MKLFKKVLAAALAGVLALSVTAGAPEEGAVSQEWNINGEKAVIGVKVVEKR